MNLTIDFSEYKPWSGAVPTYEKIYGADKLDQLETFMEIIYPNGMTTTQLNDILWFEEKWLLENLGITDEDEEDEE